MPALNAKASHDLVRRSVAALTEDSTVKKVLRSFEAALALAETTSGGESEPVIKSLKVGVHDEGAIREDGPTVTTVYDKREPIDAGPHKRTPIRVGGGSCFTVKVGKITVTVCIEWES